MIDKETLTELIEEGIDNVMDIDTGISHWAKGAAGKIWPEVEKLQTEIERLRAEFIADRKSGAAAFEAAFSGREAAAYAAGLEAAAREVLDWQGRVAMGHTHANATHDATLSRISSAIRALAEKPKEAPVWRSNSIDAHAAFAAMRNDMNELIGDMESDEATLLLRGPEMAHDCEAIVVAVARYVAKARFREACAHVAGLEAASWVVVNVLREEWDNYPSSDAHELLELAISRIDAHDPATRALAEKPQEAPTAQEPPTLPEPAGSGTTGQDVLDMMADDICLELAFTYEDEESEGQWTVYQRAGNRSDREWILRGSGQTPRAALEAALNPESQT